MWTYLVILVSLSVLFGVFVRRFYLVSKGSPPVTEEPVKEDFVEDVEDIEKVSKADKKSVEDLCEKAEIKAKTGNEDEAIKLLVQALAIDKIHIEAQHRLALLYMGKKMHNAAAALFESLGKITNDPVHYSHLGLALYQQGDNEAAKNAYQTAVSLDPSRPQRFVSLSQVYRSLGQLQNAIVALNKAMELDAENLDFLFLLADLQAEMGNTDEAKDILKRILDLDEENVEAKALLKSLS